MTELNRNKLADVVRGTNGGFFGVDFIKKDGTLRRMTCRKGVYKVEELKGKGSTVDRPDTPYVTVWDVVKRAYRVINLQTVQALRFNGNEFVVL
jgi:hypothetical protein